MATLRTDRAGGRELESPASGKDVPQTILHLINCLAPGGSEQQLLHLLRSTDRKRWRPIVGIFQPGGLLRSEVEALKVPVAEFRLHTSMWHPNTGLQLGRIVAHCLKERVRIVHAHDYYGNILGVAAARLCGARVLTSRGDLAHWLSPLKRRVLGGACRASDVVVANARAVAELTDHGLFVPEDRLAIINNGIDVAGFDREALLDPSPPIDFLDNPEDRRFTVAVVANMNTEEKGHGDLVRAAAMLAPQGLVLRLLFVGDGAQRKSLQALATELGIGAHVRFLGRRRDVPRILARVAAACLPSWAEGLPNSVLEAMLAARPVVVTSVGGCPEVIVDGESGLLVPPRDPNKLAGALKRLFQNPVHAEAMGRRARQDVAARFNLRVFMRQYHALYDDLGGVVGPPAVEE